MAQDPLTRPREELPTEPPLPDPPAPSESAPAETRPSELSALLTPDLAPAPAAPARVHAEPRLPSAARAPQPSAHATFLAQRHFGALDGLRALGILAVVWHHTMGGPGRFGANLFFLLSGFLVTTILVRERARKRSIDVTRFRTRRARRLYPLYFATLLGYVVLVWLLEPAGPSRRAFFAHLPAFASFTSNLFVALDGEHVIFYFAWSLAAQEQFYLVWPWILKRSGSALAGACLGLLLATVYATRAGVLDALLAPGTPMRALALALMPALFLGALLALTLDTRAGFDALRRVLGARWASGALLAAALVLWRMPGAPEALMHAVLAALVAACVLREDHLLARALRAPVLVHVGTVSYGIYLLHMLCHNAVARVLGRLGLDLGVLDFALSTLAAIGVATLSQRHFERRFLPTDKRLERA